MKETPPDHREYLRNDDYFLGDSVVIFGSNEIRKLRKYGAWLEALATGKIQPFTREQERFVMVAKSRAEPKTEFEQLWWKLTERRKIEAEDRTHETTPVIAAGHQWTDP